MKGSNWELDHERSGASCLVRRFFLGTDCLGAIYLLEFLVFVILTFFKEGIGNILTMPLFGSWKWVLNLGNGVLGLVGLVGLVTLVTLVA